MNIELITSLIVFSFVSTITPGPNNIMLMASGTNFGFKKSIPHMAGVTLGFSFMIIIVGIGIAQIFQRSPGIYNILKALSIIYLLWLAWKIANSSAPKENQTKSNPLTFLQASLFQWVNPKGWTMALSAVTIYNSTNSLMGLFFISLVFAVVNVPSVCVWTLLGQNVRQWLSTPKRLRIFNWSMALMLVGSLVLMINE